VVRLEEAGTGIGGLSRPAGQQTGGESGGSADELPSGHVAGQRSVQGIEPVFFDHR
jgi:hypothetical protein